MYASVKPLVIKWVRENWDKWCEERPPWFDELKMSMIPPSFIPSKSDANVIKDLRQSVAPAVPGLLGQRASLKRLASERAESAVVPVLVGGGRRHTNFAGADGRARSLQLRRASSRRKRGHVGSARQLRTLTNSGSFEVSKLEEIAASPISPSMELRPIMTGRNMR